MDVQNFARNPMLVNERFSGSFYRAQTLASILAKSLHLPEDIARHVQAQWEDVPRHVLESLALIWYQSGELNEEQIRRLLGYSTLVRVHAFLKEHGVPLRYTVEDLEQDRAAHDRLGI